MNFKYKLTCPCHFQLESVLKYEVTKIGGENITVKDGRVSFEGDEHVIARANLCLSTAERVLIHLGEFKALSFEELFQNVKKLPFEQFIGMKNAFPVKGHSLNSKLHSVPDCQSIIKKAVVERLKEKYHTGWFEETEAKVQIQFGILKDNVDIYLDSSGTGLHKRGYRLFSNAAPIKETLAAGIIDLARVRPDSVVCDPFCGSGTFLIESALRSLNIPVGINRRFAAERWSCFKKEVWREERHKAISQVNKAAGFRGLGFDNDEECVKLTLDNASKAGIKTRIDAKCRDIADFTRQKDMITICNPPYGERMLEVREAEQLYKIMGQVFAPDKEHPCYIISPHEDFEKHFGKKADKKRKLYNGMIKCDLYMYFK